MCPICQKKINFILLKVFIINYIYIMDPLSQEDIITVESFEDFKTYRKDNRVIYFQLVLFLDF